MGKNLISVSNLSFFLTPLFIVLMFGFELSFGHLVIELLKEHSILTSYRVYIMKFCHPIGNSSREMGSAAFGTEWKLCHAVLLEDLCDLI